MQARHTVGGWQDVTSPDDLQKHNLVFPALLFSPEWEVRLAPSPKLVPWTVDTFPKDRPVWVRMKPECGSARNFNLVEVFGPDCVHLASHGWKTWGELLTGYTQHDGAPCGVEVSE